MSKFTLAAGTSPFAHLLAGAAALGARAAGRRAEGEDDDTKDKPEGSRADDGDGDEDPKNKTEGSRAEDGDGDEDGDKPEGSRADDGDGDGDGDGDEDPKHKPEGKGRKAKADDQDPADDSHDDDDGGYDDDKAKKAYRRGLAAGRTRENRRAARIFGHKAAASRPDLAATLAFSTRNSSAEAIAILGTATALPAVAHGVSRLDQRMSNRTEARPGAEGGAGKPSFGERVAAAVKKSGAR